LQVLLEYRHDKKCIPEYLYNVPNTISFSELMNSDDKYVLIGLSKYAKMSCLYSSNTYIGNLWLPHLNLHMLYIKSGGNIVMYFSTPNSDLYIL
jgi:hypothetical protein